MSGQHGHVVQEGEDKESKGITLAEGRACELNDQQDLVGAADPSAHFMDKVCIHTDQSLYLRFVTA